MILEWPLTHYTTAIFSFFSTNHCSDIHIIYEKKTLWLPTQSPLLMLLSGRLSMTFLHLLKLVHAYPALNRADNEALFGDTLSYW